MQYVGEAERRSAWGRDAFVAGVLSLILLAMLGRELAGPDVELVSLATMAALCADIAILCSAVLLYIHWRIGLSSTVAWLVTGVAAFALQELQWFVLVLGQAAEPADNATWLALYQILATLGLCLLVTQSERLPVRHDPLLAGVVIGLAVMTGRAVLQASPLPEPTDHATAAVVFGLSIVGTWNAITLMRVRTMSRWLRHRLGLASILLGLGQASAFPAEPADWVPVLSIITNVLGSALLAATAFRLARGSLQDESEARAVLRRRLEAVEHDQQTDAARLHELRATVAGLATASRLLHQPSGISNYRRGQLDRMMEDELERLNRLMGSSDATTVGPVDIDEALVAVIERHRTTGSLIEWRRAGAFALGRADDIATIVSVLLSNAERHAPRAEVQVEVRQTDGHLVEVVVSDSGPGVDKRVRQRLFERGQRGPASVGQGIGLAAARSLTDGLGGYLRLEDAVGPGATFVLGLPAAKGTHDRACSA